MAEMFDIGHWMASLAVFAVVFLFVRSLMQRPRNLPPGPNPVPILGSLLQLIGRDRLEVFERFRAKYGDVFSFYMGSRLVVVVNGYKMFRETFVHNSDVFSDRPRMFTVDMVGQGKGIVNSSGEVWKEHRKFTLHTLAQFGFAKSSFENKIQIEVSKCLQILDSFNGHSLDPSDHIQTAIANIICSIAFGERFEYEDPQFKKFLEIFEENMRLVGVTSILNFFPFLQKIPGDMFKFKMILRNVHVVQLFLGDIIEQHRATFDENSTRHFVDAYLKQMKVNKRLSRTTTMADDQLLKLIGDLFVGGTETTSTTLRWALIYLVRHPHIQQRVREEIDKNLTLQDKDAMPFTRATILEIQRHADIAPFSVAHGLSRSGKIGDYVIPQDAIVIPNIHSVHFDPNIWKDPNKFRPERFLNEAGQLEQPDEFIPFSMGRRACLGKSLAKMELFIFLTAMIKSYTILPPECGELPSMEGVLGVTRTPLPYKVRFVPRHLNEDG